MQGGMPYTLDKNFIHTITQVYGERGKQWLIHLSVLINQCAQEWGVTDLRPFPDLTYNYVLCGKQGAMPVVLKLRCDRTELAQEVAALTAFKGYGGVHVLEYSQDQGAVLLGQLLPGTLLSSLFSHEDSYATTISIQLLKRLHQAVIPFGHTFPTLNQLLPDLSKDFKDLYPFLTRARRLRAQLVEQSCDPVLLHGDFHQGNIISSGSEWMIIDPQGVVGNPLYDVAVYLRNPLRPLLQSLNVKELVRGRVHQFAQAFECEEQTIIDWTYLQTTVSAYWSAHDGLVIDNHVAFLTILSEL